MTLISRPRQRALTLLLIASAALAGCAADPAPVDAGAGSGAAAADGFPLTVEHAFGETVVDTPPERVVTIGWGDLDNALALGTAPIGYYAPGAMTDELMPWTEELAGDARPEYLGPEAELDFEQIAALRPDLILAVQGHRLDDQAYARLASIAPTVMHPDDAESAWRIGRETATRQIAAALGVPDEGERLLDDLDAQIAAARASHPGLEGLTGAVVLPGDGVYYSYNTADGRGEFLASLGLELPESVAATGESDSVYLEVAGEEVGLLDGDLIVFLTENLDDDVAAGNELFERFDADFVSVAGSDRWSITLNTPPSIAYALDHLVPEIAAAVEG